MISLTLQLLQIEQTFLALPWVLMGAILAVPIQQLSFFLILKLCLATLCARVCGMSLNRYIDKEIDAQNPRTENRLLPQRKVLPFFVLLLGLLGLALFLFVCFLINSLVFSLSFVVAALLIIYPFCKRFTTSCHFVLGAIEFFAPVLAFAAASSTIKAPAIILGIIVFLWISGVDLLYSIQDIAFDRLFSIYSMSAVMGAHKARTIALNLHFVTAFLILFLGFYLHLHLLYFIGAFIAICLLFSQYRVVKMTQEKLPKSFFTLNMAMSIILFFFTLGDILIWNPS
jgi:4-hydroxybenzoate polyprenyltransferase